MAFQTSQTVFDRILAGHANHLHPVQSLDTLLIPGCFHYFYHDLNVDATLLAAFNREPHVTSAEFHAGPPSSLDVHLVSDLGQQYQATRVVHGNQHLANVSTPTWYHLRVINIPKMNPIPPPIILPAHIAAIHQLTSTITNIASAHVVRDIVSLAAGPLMRNQILATFQLFKQNSANGSLRFFRSSVAISPALHLTSDRRCLILHETLKGAGPWVVVDRLVPDRAAEISVNQDVLTLLGTPVTLGHHIDVPPAAPRQDNRMMELEDNGRIGAALRFRLYDAEKARRSATVVLNSVPVLPYAGPPPPLMPPVPTWHLWIRPSPNSTKAVQSSARQALSMLVSNPPPIALDLSNVNRVVIHFEVLQEWEIPLDQHTAFRVAQLVGGPHNIIAGDVVSVVNFDLVARSGDDIDTMLRQWAWQGVQVWFQGLCGVRGVGELSVNDEEDEPLVEHDDVEESRSPKSFPPRRRASQLAPSDRSRRCRAAGNGE